MEAKFFAAWASYIMEQNSSCFETKFEEKSDDSIAQDKKTDKLYDLCQVVHLLPSIYSQFSSLLIPNFQNEVQILIQDSMIRKLNWVDDIPFCSNDIYKPVTIRRI